MASLVDSHFKTSLPPRKRAKTDEEKEQRRVERILRNRRAAHASREKKRKHVEYLEAYVLALESNMLVLVSNILKLKDNVPQDCIPCDLETLEDLSDLKAKIHSNLSCSSGNDSCNNQSMECADSCNQLTLSSLSDETDDSHLASKLSLGSVKVKVEETEDFSLSGTQQPKSYFNYLSPVSINSSPNSPSDFTMKQEPAFPEAASVSSEGFTLSAISGPEYMVQNPAAVLSPELSSN